MAQRNSRKGGGKTKKRPELRTGGGRAAKAERAAQRQRAAERDAGGNSPIIRMRPAGVGGVLVVQLVAWLAIAAFAWGALQLDRWNQLSYPDSLWLYLSIGTVAAAAAVGRVARTVVDADVWGLEALLVPTVAFILIEVAGPGCPTGGSCAAIGARGSLGLIWSIVVLVVAALAAWGLARWQYRAAAAGRPHQGRVRATSTVWLMFWLLLFPGALIAAGLGALDLWLRDTPKLVAAAKTEVERECYGLAAAPALSARPSPNGYNPDWTTFAVRRTNESRPGIGKKSLPDDWANLGYVHPYEAVVSFSADGQVVGVSCRKVGPGTGNAVAEDLEQPEIENNPLSPKTIGSDFYPRFFTQGVAGPTEEGKKLAAEKAKEAKADAADSEDAKTDDSADAKADDGSDDPSTDDSGK